MFLASFSRLMAGLSVAYPFGLLASLSLPDPHTTMVLKLPAILLLGSLAGAPAGFFGWLHLRRFPAERASQAALAATAGVFLLTWMAATPFIAASAGADALGALAIGLVPMLHLIVWGLAAVVLVGVKRPAPR